MSERCIYCGGSCRTACEHYKTVGVTHAPPLRIMYGTASDAEACAALTADRDHWRARAERADAEVARLTADLAKAERLLGLRLLSVFQDTAQELKAAAEEKVAAIRREGGISDE